MIKFKLHRPVSHSARYNPYSYLCLSFIQSISGVFGSISTDGYAVVSQIAGEFLL